MEHILDAPLQAKMRIIVIIVAHAREQPMPVINYMNLTGFQTFRHKIYTVNKAGNPWIARFIN